MVTAKLHLAQRGIKNLREIAIGKGQLLDLILYRVKRASAASTAF